MRRPVPCATVGGMTASERRKGAMAVSTLVSSSFRPPCPQPACVGPEACGRKVVVRPSSGSGSPDHEVRRHGGPRVARHPCATPCAVSAGRQSPSACPRDGMSWSAGPAEISPVSSGPSTGLLKRLSGRTVRMPRRHGARRGTMGAWMGDSWGPGRHPEGIVAGAWRFCVHPTTAGSANLMAIGQHLAPGLLKQQLVRNAVHRHPLGER